MPMPTENPQFYRKWMVQDSQNGLCTKSLPRQKILCLDSRFVDLENSGLPATLRKHANR